MVIIHKFSDNPSICKRYITHNYLEYDSGVMVSALGISSMTDVCPCCFMLNVHIALWWQVISLSPLVAGNFTLPSCGRVMLLSVVGLSQLHHLK